METKVTLLSYTKDPIETVCKVWQASRDNNPIADVNPNSPEAIKLFQDIIESKIPVAENLEFLFLLEGVSVSLREQLVRHRIGVHVGDRVGVDIVPDLADSTWWSQSMRILNMGTFALEGRYIVPESLKDHEDESLIEEYHELMRRIERFYAAAVDAGIPMEDARNIIPLAATSRITWKLNLAALQHIIGKRGCWILQLGLWKPVIIGMVEELATKVHPLFRGLINPPCISKNCFKGCLFALDNVRRIDGSDEIPPCPLWLSAGNPEGDKDEKNWNEKVTPAQQARFANMFIEYTNLWKRNPRTGKPL